MFCIINEYFKVDKQSKRLVKVGKEHVSECKVRIHFRIDGEKTWKIAWYEYIYEWKVKDVFNVR